MKPGILYAAFVTLMLASCKGPGDLRPIDYEASRRGNEFWLGQVSRCGDYFYAVYAPGGVRSTTVFQFRDFHAIAMSFPGEHDITDADRSNGIAWKGYVVTRLAAYRVWENGAWSPWYDTQKYGGNYPDLRRQAARKINDSWEFGSDDSDRLLPIPCDQVPE